MLPKNYDHKALERWAERWEKEGIYKFNPDSGKPIFAIDTPPPYISGELHMGHAFSYPHFDIIARFKRMRGYEVFLPIGFDDNGTPTEKFVEKEYGITKKSTPREEYVKLCLEVAAKMRKTMAEEFKRLGFSFDWSTAYSTISMEVQKYAQWSFVDLYEKGLIYRAKEPVIWCTYHETALAQAVVEDKEKETELCYIYFDVDGEKLPIATTRPELLAACVAVFVHPEDERYRHFVGKKAKVPIYGFEVPVIANEEVKTDFGTGAVMVCTFGDATDVRWWKKYKLPLKEVLNEDGTMRNAGPLDGLSVEDARERMKELLEKEGVLFKREKIKQVVGVCWRCKRPVEYIVKEQWFVKLLENKEKFLEAARKIKWYPPFYVKRMEDWIENLSWDWCISRQRYYGVYFPVWYCKKCGKPKIAKKEWLPVNPFVDKPKEACECGSTEFLPETDVMDTWMTSSLTPMFVSGWHYNEELFRKTFPMQLRPQGHDIIRTWAFYTIVKALYHENRIPWENIVISGFVYAAKGVPMSKSLGTGVSLAEILDKYGGDVIRYWAASSGLGEDIVFREEDLVRGKKVLTKLWNVARFIQMQKVEAKEGKRLVDLWMWSKLKEVVDRVTQHLENYELSLARRELENFFMNTYCDDYIEMLKYRIYKLKDGTAIWNLRQSFEVILKLFAPFTPFITEEIYRNLYKDESIHVQPWPELKEYDEKAVKLGDLAVRIIEAGRKWKSENNISLGSEIEKVVVSCEEDISEIAEDIKETLRAKEIETRKGEFRVELKR